MFQRTHFSHFLLEYDDARSGFEPLQHVPDDRVVVLRSRDDEEAGGRGQGRSSSSASTKRATTSPSTGLARSARNADSPRPRKATI
ncbi:MAG: hypothetical protein R3A46_07655 [Thermomicrobiales bacterium]